MSMTPEVKAWCRQQCINQHATTEADFAGMETAWAYARAISASGVPPLIVSEIRHMARMIDPIANPNGQFRKGPAVFMDGGSAAPAQDIERYVIQLLTTENLHFDLAPEDVYRELMWIHPFKDGNGRVGALVYNMLNGTILNPVDPPEYK